MQFLIVLVSMLIASVISQESTTTQPTVPTTTPNPGVEYGGVCNGILLTCNRHQETVLCMHREPNATVGGDVCSVGLGVTIGRCQCRRNCGPSYIYEDDGEFDAEQDRCVGLVGRACSALNTHCTAHATCNLLVSKCVCNVGYIPTPDGLRCTPQTPTSTTILPTTSTRWPTGPTSAGPTSPPPEPTVTGSTTPLPEPTITAGPTVPHLFKH